MLKLKEANKKRKLYHFNNLINDFNYYAYYYINNDNMKGWAYCIIPFGNHKTAETIEAFNKKIEYVEKNYHNTLIMRSCCEYAPEIKRIWLFIGEAKK